jgi:hypothetical protein
VSVVDQEVIVCVRLAVFFDDFGGIHYIKSSRNIFDHFRENWCSERLILPKDVNHIFKKNFNRFR